MSNEPLSFPLKALRRMYVLINGIDTTSRNLRMFPSKDYANDLIIRELKSDKPSMIARFGSTELNLLINYLGIKKGRKPDSYVKYIKNEIPAWWWEKKKVKEININSGFFPVDNKLLQRFCELLINDLTEVNILGSWLVNEKYFKSELKNAKRIVLNDMDPFFTNNPWTSAIAGKNVLVVHPFTETIQKQYEKRNLIFENNLLPDFNLKTIKAVQSSAGQNTKFSDWFEALEYMKQKMNSTEYDICIIGAGAYGMPLAAHAKRMGKTAIHLGGITQLLFGIKGKRWEEYRFYPYMNLYNEHWVRPGEKEKLKNSHLVENSCYW